VGLLFLITKNDFASWTALVHKSHNSLILWRFYFLQNFDISFKINVLREITHQRRS